MCYVGGVFQLISGCSQLTTHEVGGRTLDNVRRTHYLMVRRLLRILCTKIATKQSCEHWDSHEINTSNTHTRYERKQKTPTWMMPAIVVTCVSSSDRRSSSSSRKNSSSSPHCCIASSQLITSDVPAILPSVDTDDGGERGTLAINDEGVSQTKCCSPIAGSQ